MQSAEMMENKIVIQHQDKKDPLEDETQAKENAA
jgi:hypothetical protein